MKSLFNYTFKFFLFILMIYFSLMIYKNYKEKKSEKERCFNKFLIYKEKYLSKEFRKSNGLPILELNEKVNFDNFELQLFKDTKKSYPSINSFNYYCFNNSEQIEFLINKDSTITINTFYEDSIIKNFYSLKIKNELIIFRSGDMKKAYSTLKKYNLIENNSNFFYGVKKDSLN